MSFANLNQTELHSAVLLKNELLVSSLLDAGADMYALDTNGLTPIHYAILIEKNAHEMVYLFIDHQFDVNRKYPNESNNLLIFAVKKGSDDIVKTLLDLGSITDFMTDTGSTALFEAALLKRWHAAELLLLSGANVNIKLPGDDTFLHKTVESGNIQATIMLAKLGIKVDNVNAKNETPLAIAVKKNNPAMVNFLIRRGAQINNITGDSYLEIAIENNAPESLLALLENNLSPDAQDKNGNTVLFLAACRGDINALRVLIEFGGNLHQHSSAPDGWNLAQEAARCNAAHALKWLVDNGIDIKEFDNGHNTALHYAAYRGHLEATKMAIDLGVCLNCRNDGGYTAYEDAARMNFDVVADYIKSRGGI